MTPDRNDPRPRRAMFGVAAALALATGVGSAHAQGVSSDTQQATMQATEFFWTPARLRAAVPLDLRAATRADGLPVDAAPATAAFGKSESGRGAAPTVTGMRGRQLLAPMTEQQFEASAVPFANYGFGPFTTGREQAPRSYPAMTAGKLYFHDPVTGGNFVCSASVLRPRIVMTAGHCVAHPSTSASSRYFYTGHLFVPAYNNGNAPFSTWSSSQLWVTNTWYFSDGSVPNAADEGIMIAADHGTTKIGNVTGYLGYRTLALANNNLTQFGYPCNLDSCAIMERNNAQTIGAGGNNTYTFGSAMAGGSSGGPWIQDFGVAPAGSSGLGLNYLVGVTSYGPSGSSGYIGLSQFDNNFLSLLNSACTAASGNC